MNQKCCVSMVIYQGYRERIQRIRKLMERYTLDVLILTDSRDVTYCTGHLQDGAPAWGGTAFVLPLEGEPALIIPEERYLSRFNMMNNDVWSTWVKNFVPFIPKSQKNLMGQLIETCTKILEEMRLNASTIGLSLNSFLYDDYLTIKNALSNVILKNSTPLMDEVIQQPDDEELTLVKKAVEIADAGIDAAIEVIDVSVPLSHVMAEVSRAMYEAGLWTVWATGGHGLGLCAVTGRDAIMSGGLTPERRIRRDDPVKLDLQAAYKFYGTCHMHELMIGVPSEDDRKIYDFMMNIISAALIVATPGNKLSDIAKFCLEEFKKAGYDSRYSLRGFFGHSNGIELGSGGRRSMDITPDNNIEI